MHTIDSSFVITAPKRKLSVERQGTFGVGGIWLSLTLIMS